MRIYLDHAASTPVRPSVAAVMLHYSTDPELMGNPSSSHADGRAARQKLEELRARAAAHFACDPAEVLFNSGGSEGDSHAVLGTVRAQLAGGNRRPRIAVSAVEHEAVVQAAQFARELGAELAPVRCDSDGVVAMEAVRDVLRDFSPQLVCVMAVNNETGVVQPVAEIAALCRDHGAVYHCDAVRAVGHGLPEVQCRRSIGLLCATGHKFGGPRGVGVLVVRRSELSSGYPVASLVCGGGQEHGLRAGTENLAGAAGLVEALDLATDEEAQQVESLRIWLEDEILARWPSCVVHGKAAPRATGITSVAFPGYSGLHLMGALDARGISVGVGSACHSGADGAGIPTLAAMGVPAALAGATLRISLGWSTTEEHVSGLLDALGELL